VDGGTTHWHGEPGSSTALMGHQPHEVLQIVARGLAGGGAAGAGPKFCALAAPPAMMAAMRRPMATAARDARMTLRYSARPAPT
jgi:hypothetical protein